jgi:alpha-1,4-N-acetylglucosaminyltransferase EXTL3
VADQFSVNLTATSDDDDQVRLAEYLELTNASLGGSHGQFFHHMLSGNYQKEQFTIVVLSYKREQLLMDALEIYLKTPYLHSVLVVWNAEDVEPSVEFQQRFHLYVASHRLRVLRSRVNSLNNRFLPYDAIQTDAVLSLDDDVLLR